MDVDLKVLFEQVNDVLAQWNPIGVPPEIAKREYTSYAWQIIGRLQRDEDLYESLRSILVGRMGLHFDEANPAHREDLQSLCDQVRGLYKHQ